MAVGADLDVHVALGGTSHELVPAGAPHVGLFVFGMDVGLHGSYQCRRSTRAQQDDARASRSPRWSRRPPSAGRRPPATPRPRRTAGRAGRRPRLARAPRRPPARCRSACRCAGSRRRTRRPPAAAVEDHRDVARRGRRRTLRSDQVRPQVGLPADRRGRALGAHRLAPRVAPAEVDDRPVAGGHEQRPRRSCRRCTCARRRRRDPRRRSRRRRPCASFGASGVDDLQREAQLHLRPCGTRSPGPRRRPRGSSRSQLTSTALPNGRRGLAAGASRQKRAAQSPMMRLQRIMRTKNPARRASCANLPRMPDFDWERPLKDLHELAELTGGPDGARRLAWSEDWRTAREWLLGKLEETDATVERDVGREPVGDDRGRVGQDRRRRLAHRRRARTAAGSTAASACSRRSRSCAATRARSRRSR